MQPTGKKNVVWSADLSYIVGLIATDGCLSSDGRHIDLTSKDLQLLKTFKKCLALSNKIGLKSSGFSNKKYYRVQFGNVILYKWLSYLGITPRKSITIGALKIPNKYFFDFLRGSFDGDGTCYSYWDPRWASSFMFYINFTSGSLKHLKWIRGRIKQLLKVNGHLTQGNRAWQLKYAKKESMVIIPKMYYKESLPCLRRKYIKLKKILAVEKQERVLELVDSLD